MPLRTCGAEQPGRGGLGTDTRSSVAARSAVGTWRSNSPDARGRRACFTSFCNRHYARTDTTGQGQGGAVRPGDVRSWRPRRRPPCPPPPREMPAQPPSPQSAAVRASARDRSASPTAGAPRGPRGTEPTGARGGGTRPPSYLALVEHVLQRLAPAAVTHGLEQRLVHLRGGGEAAS